MNIRPQKYLEEPRRNAILAHSPPRAEYLCRMKLTYSDIISRCKDISAYEGGRINDANGNSMFSIVRITEQDYDLLKEFVKQSATTISEIIRFAIEDTQFDATGVTFTFLSDTRLHGDCNDTEEAIEGTIVSYVMTQWLSNKSTERTKAWSEIYAEQIRLLPRAFKKKRPTLDNNY